MSLISAIVGISANNDAANVAKENDAANDALAQNIYNSDKAEIQPYADRGDAAGDELSGFLGLGGDPAKTQAAFNDYLNSTGYRFAYGQGLDAVNANAAARGLADSGAAAKALDAYGTGLADQYGQQYVGDLQGLDTSGLSAVNALTGAGTNFVNQTTANNNLGAQAAANAYRANAAAINAALGQGTQAAGNAIGASSYGGAGANPFALASVG